MNKKKLEPYMEKGEWVRLRDDNVKCPPDRENHSSARLYAQITSCNQDTGKVTMHGWCLDRDLRGSRYHPSANLEVIEE